MFGKSTSSSEFHKDRSPKTKEYLTLLCDCFQRFPFDRQQFGCFRKSTFTKQVPMVQSMKAIVIAQPIIYLLCRGAVMQFPTNQPAEAGIHGGGHGNCSTYHSHCLLGAYLTECGINITYHFRGVSPMWHTYLENGEAI